MRVRPLKWQENPEDGESVIADAFGLTYEAGVDAAGDAYWKFFRDVSKPSVDVDGGLEDAKAAAQADYERRILSVIDTKEPLE